MEYEEEELVERKEIVSCCQSYRTAQGRCYDCPNDDGDFDDLVEEEDEMAV